MAVEWYVCVGGDQKGPLSTDELRRWLKEGRITLSTFAKQGPASPWRPLKDLLPRSADWSYRLALLASVLLGLEVALLVFADPATAKLVVTTAAALGLASLVLRGGSSTPQSAG